MNQTYIVTHHHLPLNIDAVPLHSAAVHSRSFALQFCQHPLSSDLQRSFENHVQEIQDGMINVEVRAK